MLGCNFVFILQADSWNSLRIVLNSCTVQYVPQWLEAINSMSKGHEAQDRLKVSIWSKQNNSIKDHISPQMFLCQAVTVFGIISMRP